MMAVHLSRTEVRAKGAAIAEQPRLRLNRAGRPWDLHPALFAMTAGAFFLFLGILGSVTLNSELAIPFAIFVIFLVAFFAIPTIFARVAPRRPGRYQSWSEFLAEGIQVESGHLSGRNAAVQVLLVPTMLVGWSVFVAVFFAAIR